MGYICIHSKCLGLTGYGLLTFGKSTFNDGCLKTDDFWKVVLAAGCWTSSNSFNAIVETNGTSKRGHECTFVNLPE